MRKTRIAEELKEMFARISRPITVSEIIANLHDVGIRPNKTTVYRQVEKMETAGEIEHIHLEGRSLGYEKKSEHHHHMVCKNCRQVEDLYIEGEKEMLKAMLFRKGFKAEEHHLEIFGLCRSCK